MDNNESSQTELSLVHEVILEKSNVTNIVSLNKVQKATKLPKKHLLHILTVLADPVPIYCLRVRHNGKSQDDHCIREEDAQRIFKIKLDN